MCVPLAAGSAGAQTPDPGPQTPGAAASLGAQIGSIVSEQVRASDEIGDGSVLDLPPAARVGQPRSSEPTELQGPRQRGKYAMAWPVRNVVTSPFGWRRSGFHHGVDVRCWYGTPIRAAKGGKVVYSSWHPVYGRTIIIEHSYGFRTLYGHMTAWGTTKGRWVGPDQIIGYCGSTGRSTGPHLHFEIYRWGRIVNPMAFLP